MNTVQRACGSLLNSLVRSESGALLVEATIAVMVFASVGTAVLTGVSIVHTSGVGIDHQSMAENIGRNQMEFVASQAYQAPPFSYPAIGTPVGYTVTAEAIEDVPGDTNIEKIIVTVLFEGVEILTLETFRANVTF